MQNLELTRKQTQRKYELSLDKQIILVQVQTSILLTQ